MTLYWASFRMLAITTACQRIRTQSPLVEREAIYSKEFLLVLELSLFIEQLNVPFASVCVCVCVRVCV